MQQFVNCFIEFIIANWRWLAPIVLSVVEAIIILIFKKRPIIQDLGVTDRVLTLVNDAEDHYPNGHGLEKRQYVFTNYRNLYPEDPIADIWLWIIIDKILYVHKKKKGGN